MKKEFVAFGIAITLVACSSTKDLTYPDKLMTKYESGEKYYSYENLVSDLHSNMLVKRNNLESVLNRLDKIDSNGSKDLMNFAYDVAYGVTSGINCEDSNKWAKLKVEGVKRNLNFAQFIAENRKIDNNYYESKFIEKRDSVLNKLMGPCPDIYNYVLDNLLLE